MIMNQIIRRSLCNIRHYFPRTARSQTGKTFAPYMCAAAVGMTLQSHCEKLKPPDADTLTHEYLIRNASMTTIDSASALLGQTMAALLQAQQEYLQAMEKLITFMELSTQVLGSPQHEDAIWQQVLEARSAVSQSSKQKQELDMVYQSAEKVIESAAEAAFLSGMEAYSLMASERLQSAKQQLAANRAEVDETEDRLRQMEALVINVISKHAKMKQKKKEESDQPEDILPEDSSSNDNQADS